MGAWKLPLYALYIQNIDFLWTILSYIDQGRLRMNPFLIDMTCIDTLKPIMFLTLVWCKCLWNLNETPCFPNQ